MPRPGEDGLFGVLLRRAADALAVATYGPRPARDAPMEEWDAYLANVRRVMAAADAEERP